LDGVVEGMGFINEALEDVETAFVISWDLMIIVQVIPQIEVDALVFTCYLIYDVHCQGV
jgi:hypothetical protein